MDFIANRNDAMDVETSEEDKAEEKILEILQGRKEFEETWKMLDNFAALISEDKKQNYTNLKAAFENFTKHAAKIASISGSVHEAVRASFAQSLEAGKKQISKLEELIAEKDRIIDGKDQELKTQFDKLTSGNYELQIKIDELQKSLVGAQNDLKAETRLKNQRNEVILEIQTNLEKRQKELNHEVRSRLKNIKERDDAISELNIAKTKLEELEQQRKDDKQEIENLRKENEKQNTELSDAVDFRIEALGAIKQASMPSYCSTHCSCLLTRAYLTDASSLYRRYYVLQQTVLLAEQLGTKEHPKNCPKHRKQNTSLSKEERILIIDEHERLFAQKYSNLQKRKAELDGAIGIGQMDFEENSSISEDTSIAGTSTGRQQLPARKKPKIQVRPNMSCGVNQSKTNTAKAAAAKSSDMIG